VEKIKKNVKNVKKRDLNKKRKKTFITSMMATIWQLAECSHCILR